MIKRQIITIVFLVISFFSMHAQMGKADKLFARRSFVEAAEAYTKVAMKKPSKEVFEKLGDCYFYNNKMTRAAKWYEKALLKYPEAMDETVLFRYLQVLKSQKEYAKVDQWTATYNEIAENKIDETNTLDLVSRLSHSIIKNIAVKNVTANTKKSEFGATYYGDEVLIASPRIDGKVYSWNQQGYLDIFTTTVGEEGDLTNMQPFSPTINSDLHEANMTFTADGKTVYFTRNSKKKDENKVSHLKIYSASLNGGAWGNIQELPFCGDTFSVAHPALNEANDVLYFASDMEGTLGGFDLFRVAIKKDGTYGAPVNLGPTINTPQREQFPFISSIGDLYFTSDGLPGIGGLDIFKATPKDTTFNKPKNMGMPFNSSMDDFSFIMDEMAQTGYFSSNRLDGKGDDDVYAFYTESLTLYGKVKDKTSQEVIPEAMVVLYDGNGEVLDEMQVGEDGYYEFELAPNGSYGLKGTKDLYIPSATDFATDYKGDVEKDIFLEMETYEVVEPKIVVVDEKPQIVLNPIYFDFDKWNIRPDAAKELDEAVAILVKYPEMQIEIGSHTDRRGDATYNQQLSEKRAKSTMNYMISKGVNAGNMTYKGYGESQPKVTCGKDCTERDHDINRRSEFVLKR